MNLLNAKDAVGLLCGSSTGTVYLVGAGGCGMSALGHLFLDLGFKVAGSDLELTPEALQLLKRGAVIHQGHHPANLQSASPFLIVYSSAIKEDNLELCAARSAGLPLARRGSLLAALVNQHRGICVAGMHGKTTTTALLSFALEQLGAAPNFAIGGSVPQLERHARMALTSQQTSGSYFIAEADESDATFSEYAPRSALLLNLDEEHLDHYGGFSTVCREFKAFSQRVQDELFYCADDAELKGLLAGRPRAFSYGFDPSSDYQIKLLNCSNGGAFELCTGGRLLGEFHLSLLGSKNVSNAAGVVAFLHKQGFQPEDIAGAIRQFQGAARRQEELFRHRQYRIFDDYGHHPKEIEAALQAFRSLSPGRLLVAFQPHRFTRTKALAAKFAACFSEADLLWLTEIYPANEPVLEGITGKMLGNMITARGQEVQFIPTLPELAESVRRSLQPGDLAVFLGAGDITSAAHQLAAQLQLEDHRARKTFFQKLKAGLSSETLLLENEPLSRRTTFRLGGPADCYVEPCSEAELAFIVNCCASHEIPLTVLGRGSNLLVKDGGIRGVVLSLAHPAFSRITLEGETLACGAGARLKQISIAARQGRLAGLEFLEGIPGTVGGALRMNAGAMGSAMFKVIKTVRYMDPSGNIHELPAEQIEVQYRSCSLLKNNIALGAVLAGRPASTQEIGQRMSECSQKRWKSQPAAASAGCIFKNPATIPAGKLIEEMGLKGLRSGGAVVSTLHGNFIINEGNATTRDVLSLIETIQQRTRRLRGIHLETEVQIVGEDPFPSNGRPAQKITGLRAENVILKKAVSLQEPECSSNHPAKETIPSV